MDAFTLHKRMCAGKLRTEGQKVVALVWKNKDNLYKVTPLSDPDDVKEYELNPTQDILFVVKKYEVLDDTWDISADLGEEDIVEGVTKKIKGKKSAVKHYSGKELVAVRIKVRDIFLRKVAKKEDDEFVD